MKENRTGTIICIKIAILSLVLSIIFSVFGCNWFTNFSFAIMGSASLSFVICLINYIIFRKKLIEELINGLYVFNNDTNAQLYLFNIKKDVGCLATAIGVASAHLTKLSYLAYSIKDGLFGCEKEQRRLTKEIIKKIEFETHFKLYSIGQYLQKKKEQAEKESKYIYKQIEDILKDETLYNLAYDLGKSVKSAVKKTEEVFNKPIEKIKDSMCILVEKELSKMKAEENIEFK